MMNISHEGERKTFCIDDFVPCLCYDGIASGPICSRSHSSAFWVTLIEKSFAKLYGGYASLSKLSAASSLRDLSGSPCVTVDVPRTKEGHGSNNVDRVFWSRLASYCSKNYVLIAKSTPPRRINSPESFQNTSQYRDDRGLVINYTYTILDVKSSSLGDYIIQLRCPLNIDNFDWSGDWSDSSDKWTEELQYELEVNIDEDNRSFWMSYFDFCDYFAALDVAMVKHPHQGREGAPSSNWTSCRQKLWFTRLNDTSPQLRPSAICVLKVADSASEVFFTLHQQGLSTGESLDTKQLNALGLVVLRVTPDFCFEVACSSKYSVSSCIELSELLPVGVYLIVPVTYVENDRAKGAPLPNAIAGQDSLPPLIDTATGCFTKRADDVLSDIFARLDGDMDGVCDALTHLLARCPTCVIYSHRKLTLFIRRC